MTEFTYTVGGASATITIEEELDPGRLVYKVEKALLVALEEKGYEIDPQDRRYLQSRIAIAITRDLLSKQFVDLGNIKAKVREQPPEGGARPSVDTGDIYTLTNIKDGQLAKRKYDPDQSIGAIVADIRRLYDLGMNDNIIVFQVVNGERREVSPTTRVGELASKDLNWEVRKYE